MTATPSPASMDPLSPPSNATSIQASSQASTTLPIPTPTPMPISPPSAGAQRVSTITVATEIVVCTTCRPAGVPRDQTAPGQRLYDAVQAALGAAEPGPEGAQLGAQLDAQREAQSAAADSTPRLKLRGLACMSGCDRACTVALQAPGKFSYYFGDLSADAETAVQLIACAQLHRDSADGTLLRNARPERLRSGILARLPAVESVAP